MKTIKLFILLFALIPVFAQGQNIGYLPVKDYWVLKTKVDSLEEQLKICKQSENNLRWRLGSEFNKQNKPYKVKRFILKY